MKITSEHGESATVIHLAGSADVATVDAIRKALADGMEKSNQHVICNLAEMDFICSDALGALISAHQEAQAGGGFLRLAHPCRRIAGILATTQLNRLFPVFDSLEEALKP